MGMLLLAIIYIAFISLGLPDSLLGSAWPVMHVELGASVSAAGAVSMIIAAGTIFSSLASDFLTRKLGTGAVTAVSVLLTAAAMLGFSFARAFWVLCVLAVPYGLGAGGVDAALNNYVALHYKARHMSWLHCFWGLGAIISPYIMGGCLSGGIGWEWGYRIVALLQFALTAGLFASLPLWKRRAARLSPPSAEAAPAQEAPQKHSLLRTLRLRGVGLVLVAFFCYCALEQTTMLWASSYLVAHRGVTEECAAMFASLFFAGITVGRFVCGFFSEKLGDRVLIRIGIAAAAVGIGLVALPVESDACALAGFVVIGLGCAPVYPSIIHATPANFGKEHSQAVIGVEMAGAYVGTTLMPPLFGLIAEHADIAWLPLFLGAFAALLLLTSELLNRTLRRAAETAPSSARP